MNQPYLFTIKSAVAAQANTLIYMLKSERVTLLELKERKENSIVDTKRYESQKNRYRLMECRLGEYYKVIDQINDTIIKFNTINDNSIINGMVITELANNELVKEACTNFINQDGIYDSQKYGEVLQKEKVKSFKIHNDWKNDIEFLEDISEDLSDYLEPFSTNCNIEEAKKENLNNYTAAVRILEKLDDDGEISLKEKQEIRKIIEKRYLMNQNATIAIHKAGKGFDKEKEIQAENIEQNQIQDNIDLEAKQMR